jgi:hypothetical protein
MGHELTLQAITVPSLLLERLKAGEIDPQLLVFVDYYFDQRRKSGKIWNDFADGAPERVPFVESLERMLVDDPKIDCRCCHLDRQYSWLHMMLESVAGSDSDGELARWAVLGERQISPNATSTQGFQIRWNTPETCEIVDAWLAEIEEPKVRAGCNIDILKQKGSYKIQQAPDDEFVIETIVKSFQLLKDFYNAVVHHKNGVLFDKD